jgi:hypothetical protein
MYQDTKKTINYINMPESRLAIIIRLIGKIAKDKLVYKQKKSSISQEKKDFV